MQGVEERIRDAGEELAGKVGAAPSFENVVGHPSPRASHRALIAVASFAIFFAAVAFAWNAFSPGHSTSPGQDAGVFMAVDPHTTNMQMAALLRAPLVIKNGCVLVGDGSSLTLPIWPKGFTAGLDETGRVVIRDADQGVVAIEGQQMDMGGGYVAEFQPAGKVDPKDQQIAAVESGLGYQFPEACLSGIYGIWQVGQTTPIEITSAPPSLNDSANPADSFGPGIGPDLAGGSNVTLAEARNMTNLPMLLPETSLASDSNVSDVLVRTDGSDYVLLEYSSGINVEIRPWPAADIAPDDHWKALMNQGIPGRILNVGGQDVFVVPSSETAKGSASFVVNQTFVSIIGNGTQSEDDLVALMQSAMSSARAS